MSWVLLSSLAFAGDLEAAYQKEFAYLRAEKQQLQQRLDELDVESAQRLREREREVESLQGRLIQLSLEADRADRTLSEAEQSAWSAEEDAERVETLIGQAEASGFTVTDSSDEAASLTELFEQAAVKMAEGGQVRAAEGSWFLADGTQTTGTLVQVGHIAAYGSSPQGSGVLAPAGEGRLQLWPEQAAVAADSIAQGQVPATLPIFLYEDLSKPVVDTPAKTFGDIVEGGGVVGLIILGLGAVSVLLMLFRAFILRRVGDPEAEAEAIAKELDAGKLDAALTRAQADTPAGRLARSILAAKEQDLELVEDLAAEAVLRETPAIERMGAAILVIAAVAPLLGLLGTVTGMIATFDVITEFGTGDPKMLSGGISEALITTQLGLIVAIPAVLFGNLLSSRTDEAVGRLERGAVRLVNALALSRDGTVARDEQGQPVVIASGQEPVAHA